VAVKIDVGVIHGVFQVVFYQVPGAGSRFTEAADCTCPGRGATWTAPRVLAT